MTALSDDLNSKENQTRTVHKSLSFKVEKRGEIYICMWILCLRAINKFVSIADPHVRNRTISTIFFFYTNGRLFIDWVIAFLLVRLNWKQISFLINWFIILKVKYRIIKNFILESLSCFEIVFWAYNCVLITNAFHFQWKSKIFSNFLSKETFALFLFYPHQVILVDYANIRPLTSYSIFSSFRHRETYWKFCY